MNYDVDVSIQNLGAVKSAEFRVKPLTVFIGNNNTGKTWIAETVCSLIDQTAGRAFSNVYSQKDSARNYPVPITEISDIAASLVKGEAVSFNLVEFVSKNFDKYFENLSRSAQSWVNPIIGTDIYRFTDFQLTLKPSVSKEEVKRCICQLSFEDKWGIGNNFQKIFLNKKENDPVLNIYISNDTSLAKLSDESIRQYVYDMLLSLIHRFLGENVYYLPAERTGVVAFLQNFTQIQPNMLAESVPYRPSSLSGLAHPVQTMLNLIQYLQSIDIARNLTVHHNLSVQGQKLSKLADILEHEILGGRVYFEELQELHSQKLRFLVDADSEIHLELSASSSTVKDMVPLVLYLRYYLDRGDTLFIDEPEMNLHPENQAKFMEFLTLLVNSGVRVVMVTHSPYMVNHLDSLICAAENSHPSEIKDVFYLKREGVFIKRENVAVYEVKDGEVCNILFDDGIAPESYDKVAENVSSIFMRV